jgi:hypothetical protein
MARTVSVVCNLFSNREPRQCVAASRISKNLGISFDCLKSEMTGTAPRVPLLHAHVASGKTVSLGKAISVLSPSVNVD